jgi:dienelactone hydrolase
MDFDPFVRGSLPVGVRSSELVDARRGDRVLPVEVWYPAAPRYFGLDLSPATQDQFSVLPNTPPVQQAAVRDAAIQPGSYPLVLYSHTSLGHRRQSTFLCTHLASHGYVVAAADHTGNTFGDLVARARAGTTLSPTEREALIQRIIADRLPDLRALADSLLGPTNADISAQIDAARIGLVGWSFGGWAVLGTLEVDDRFGAVVALAPGGSSKPLPGIIPAQLTFAWERAVPTLFLVAERDRFTPLSGMVELYDRTPSSKQMFVLRHADHDHFGDHIEVELVPRQHAHLFTRSLALAHLEAALKSNAAASQFLHEDAAGVLQSRGVAVYAHPQSSPP